MSTYYVHLVAFCPPFSAGQLMLITNGRPVFLFFSFLLGTLPCL
jgi:hypothetical protein